MANLRPLPGDGKPSRPSDYDVGRAIRAAALTPSAKLMLWAVYDHAGPNGTGKCWTSSENLANEISIGGKAENRDRQARKLIDGLAKGRWVVVVPRGESKHARVRDILIGPKLWEFTLGHMSPSDPGSQPDSGALELGPGSPGTRTPESYSLGPGSPTNVSMNDTKNGTGTPQPARSAKRPSSPKANRGGGFIADQFVSLCVERFGEACREPASKAAAEEPPEVLLATTNTVRECNLRSWEEVRSILDDPIPF